jgi:hypothetical protein
MPPENDYDTKYKIQEQARDIADLKKGLESLQKDRDSAFRWGIIILGTAVIGMGTWIFNFIINGHVK